MKKGRQNPLLCPLDKAVSGTLWGKGPLLSVFNCICMEILVDQRFLFGRMFKQVFLYRKSNSVRSVRIKRKISCITLRNFECFNKLNKNKNFELKSNFTLKINL